MVVDTGNPLTHNDDGAITGEIKTGMIHACPEGRFIAQCLCFPNSGD